MSWSSDISSVEKSNVMEEHYAISNDPWGNRERQLYQKVLKYGSKRLFELFNKNNNNSRDVYFYDIGVGGGNVLDTVIENRDKNLILHVGGSDISESAINYLYNSHNYDNYDPSFEILDEEEFYAKNENSVLKYADLITIVDVMYYWGSKRDYRTTLDEIWKYIKSGAIVLVADSIIPYQRRSYYKSKSDCKVIEEYTDYTVPMGQLNDTNKQRYLKVKIYQKL